MCDVQFWRYTLILSRFLSYHKILLLWFLNMIRDDGIICFTGSYLLIIDFLACSYVLSRIISKLEIARLKVISCVYRWSYQAWLHSTRLIIRLNLWFLEGSLLTTYDRSSIPLANFHFKIVLPVQLNHFSLIVLSFLNGFRVLMGVIHSPINEVLAIWFGWHFYRHQKISIIV